MCMSEIFACMHIENLYFICILMHILLSQHLQSCHTQDAWTPKLKVVVF